MRRAKTSDEWALEDAEKASLGSRFAAPSAGNAYGALVAPTLDPFARPDVLRSDGYHSSLLSGSQGHDYGELLAPGVTQDGRIIDPDAADALAERTGQHLGIYSSTGMADQAAEAMHNLGAEQMRSPGFKPTHWTREDAPGLEYKDRNAQQWGIDPKPIGPQAMFNDQDGDEQDPERLQRPNQNQLAGVQQRGSVDPRAYETGQLIGLGQHPDNRVQADPTNSGSANGWGLSNPDDARRWAGTDKPAGGVAQGFTPSALTRGFTGAAASTSPAGTAAPGALAAGSPVPPPVQGGAAAGGAQAAGAGAMPWVGAIANQLAQRAQEAHMRRMAQANLAAQYAGSQGNFPMYGYQGQMANQRINDQMGGQGLNLGRLFRRGR